MSIFNNNWVIQKIINQLIKNTFVQKKMLVGDWERFKTIPRHNWILVLCFNRGTVAVCSYFETFYKRDGRMFLINIFGVVWRDNHYDASHTY